MMTSENKISVQIRLSFRDLLGAYRLYRAAATKEKDSHTIIGFLLLLLVGAYFAFRVLQPPVISPNTVDISLIVMTIGFVFGWIYILDLIPIALSWILFRRYIQQNPKPYQLVFDDSGIKYTNQNANAIYEWNFYQEAFEGKTVFILTYGKRLYSTIPKSAFQTENDIDAFREILKDHLTSCKQELRI